MIIETLDPPPPPPGPSFFWRGRGGGSQLLMFGPALLHDFVVVHKAFGKNCTPAACFKGTM